MTIQRNWRQEADIPSIKRAGPRVQLTMPSELRQDDVETKTPINIIKASHIPDMAARDIKITPDMTPKQILSAICIEYDEVVGLYHGSPVGNIKRLKGGFDNCVWLACKKEISEDYAGGAGSMYDCKLKKGRLLKFNGIIYIPELLKRIAEDPETSELAAERASKLLNGNRGGFSHYWSDGSTKAVFEFLSIDGTIFFNDTIQVNNIESIEIVDENARSLKKVVEKIRGHLLEKAKSNPKWDQ